MRALTWSPYRGMFHVTMTEGLVSFSVPIFLTLSLSVSFPLSIPFSLSVSLTITLSFPLSLPFSFSLWGCRTALDLAHVRGSHCWEIRVIKWSEWLLYRKLVLNHHVVFVWVSVLLCTWWDGRCVVGSAGETWRGSLDVCDTIHLRCRCSYKWTEKNVCASDEHKYVTRHF